MFSDYAHSKCVLFCFVLLTYRAGGRMAASDSRSAHSRREQVSFTLSY